MIVNKINQGDTWIPSAQALNTLINSANRMAPIGAGGGAFRLGRDGQTVVAKVWNATSDSIPSGAPVSFYPGNGYGSGVIPYTNVLNDNQYIVVRCNRRDKTHFGIALGKIGSQGFGECAIYGLVDVELDEAYVEGSLYAKPVLVAGESPSGKFTSDLTGYLVVKRYDIEEVRYATILFTGMLEDNEKHIKICGANASGQSRTFSARDIVAVQGIKTDLSAFSSVPTVDDLVFYADSAIDGLHDGKSAVVQSGIEGSDNVGFANIMGEWDVIRIYNRITEYSSHEYRTSETIDDRLYASASGNLDTNGVAKYILGFTFNNMQYAVINRTYRREAEVKGAFDVRFVVSGNSITLDVYDSSNPSSQYAGYVSSVLRLDVGKASFSLNSLSSTKVVYLSVTYNFVTDELASSINIASSLPSPGTTGNQRTWIQEIAKVLRTYHSSADVEYKVQMSRPLGNIELWGMIL